MRLGYCPTCDLWFLGLAPRRNGHPHRIISVGNNTKEARSLSLELWERMARDNISDTVSRLGYPRPRHDRPVLPWPLPIIKEVTQ
mgnify:CR=1 FL=1